MAVIRTVNRPPLATGTETAEPTLMRSAFAVSSVTAAWTSGVPAVTLPRTAYHLPARRVACSGSADCVVYVSSGSMP